MPAMISAKAAKPRNNTAYSRARESAVPIRWSIVMIPSRASAGSISLSAVRRLSMCVTGSSMVRKTTKVCERWPMPGCCA